MTSYEKIIIREYLELKKYWESDNNGNYNPMPFKEAIEYYGFYIEKIVLNKPFEIN